MMINGPNESATEEQTNLDLTGETFDYTIATINLLLGLQAIILNSFVVAFHRKKTNSVVPFLYLVVSYCDLITGIGAL